MILNETSELDRHRDFQRDKFMAPDWSDNRHDDRFPILIGLSIRERHCKARLAELLDLSRRGCRVRNNLLRAGQPVWVTLDGLAAIESIAIWCRNGELGIRFTVPLYPAVLSHLVTTHGLRSGSLC